MSPLSRAARYVKAYMGIGELNRLTTSLIDRPEEMLAETVKYCDAFLHPFQVPEELVRLMEDVKKLNPQTVLEIGTVWRELQDRFRDRRLPLFSLALCLGDERRDVRRR